MCCRSRRALTSLAQQTRPRRRAPIPRPNPKHNQHSNCTPNPIKNDIRIPRSTQNPNDRRQHQTPARRHSPHPTPHQSAKPKPKQTSKTHLSGGNSASRVQDAKSTRTRYGATERTLWSPPAVDTAAPKPAVASVRAHTASTGAVRGKSHVRSSRTCSASCGDG